MSAEAVFLQVIHDHPHDDAPRLVYADWLEERGDPRAEFIRLQITLAGMPDDDPRRDEAFERADELVGRHGKAWCAAVPRRFRDCRSFDRGFCRPARRLTTAGFRRLRPEAFRGAPLWAVGLRRSPGDGDRWAGSSNLRFVSALDLFSQGVGDSAVEALAANPHAVHLADLDLSANRLTGRSLVALADSPHLGRLALLDLSGNSCGAVPEFDEASVTAFCRSPRLARLRLVVMDPCRLSRPSWERLLDRFGGRLNWHGSFENRYNPQAYR
jgi:uncharacterized protein (TIGR02996 family)